MARLYADEDFPYPVVLELRRLGHEVLTVQEAGKEGDKLWRYSNTSLLRSLLRPRR